MKLELDLDKDIYAIRPLMMYAQYISKENPKLAKEIEAAAQLALLLLTNGEITKLAAAGVRAANLALRFMKDELDKGE